jgi:tetratricopeptide (TPR) repeat protein
VPARVVLGIYLVLDNLLPFLFSRGSGGGGVAHGAHIGGFIAGLMIAWMLDRRGITEAPREYRGIGAVVGATTEEVSVALGRGDLAAAATAYFALPPEATRRLLRPEESLALAEGLVQSGHPEAALTIYRRHLRDYPLGPGAAEAHLGAGLVLLRSGDQVAAAYQHFLDALDLDPGPDIAARAREALAEVAARQKYAMPRYRG